MNPRRNTRPALLVVASIVAMSFLCGQAFAEAPPAATTQPTTFLRYIEESIDAGRLETAIATYTNADGIQVDLVAAVHLGDEGYYQNLNKLFTGYDALLYEMVKEEGAAPPEPGAAPRSTIGALQRMMQNALELQYQLDGIDYTAKNFVHADMDLTSFYKAQEERGESMLSLMLRTMLDQMSRPEAMENQPTGEEILFALLSPDRSHQLKLVMGRQFGNVEEMVAGMNGPDGSVILTERNKAALKVLGNVIKKGDKHIGIFYGAAHMVDMSQRLEAMGFKLKNTKWEVAWDIRATPTTQPATQPAHATTQPAAR